MHKISEHPHPNMIMTLDDIKEMYPEVYKRVISQEAKYQPHDNEDDGYQD